MSDYFLWILLAALIGVFFWRMQRGRISAEQARDLMGNGAIVFDVRSPGEFASGNLPPARNIPVEQVHRRAPELVPDKATPILCHCATGVRSGSAVARLRRMGYQQAFNLGSFRRAASVLKN